MQNANHFSWGKSLCLFFFLLESKHTQIYFHRIFSDNLLFFYFAIFLCFEWVKKKRQPTSRKQRMKAEGTTDIPNIVCFSFHMSKRRRKGKIIFMQLRMVGRKEREKMWGKLLILKVSYSRKKIRNRKSLRRTNKVYQNPWRSKTFFLQKSGSFDSSSHSFSFVLLQVFFVWHG